ncbi:MULTISPECIES: hypothetical protein [unclassified Bradyrhizobium]|uniref:hypothetical protein n=1 Tax=unclassified Bradyrhizobium TaxID=2631580 RepID=UPI002915F8BB|nr:MULTISPECIES: hypothetical protein [unclassified Bradyrhizobium]
MRDKIEVRGLAGLKDRLVSSEAVAEAVCAYAKETNRLNYDRRAQAESDHSALQKIKRTGASIIGSDREWALPAVEEGAEGRA